MPHRHADPVRRRTAPYVKDRFRPTEQNRREIQTLLNAVPRKPARAALAGTNKIPAFNVVFFGKNAAKYLFNPRPNQPMNDEYKPPSKAQFNAMDFDERTEVCRELLHDNVAQAIRATSEIVLMDDSFLAARMHLVNVRLILNIRTMQQMQERLRQQTDNVPLQLNMSTRATRPRQEKQQRAHATRTPRLRSASRQLATSRLRAA